MKPYPSNTLDELLQMSLSEDVLDRILAMLAQEQCKKLHKTLRQNYKASRLPKKRISMINIRSVAISLFAVVLSVNYIHAQDLSRYRGFHFGMSLQAVVKETGMAPSEVRVINDRPALVQELVWRPLFSLGSSTSQTDSIKTIAFSFYNGELYQIVVDYDPSKTRGLSTKDLVEAISTTYGIPTAPTPTFISISSLEIYSDNKLVDARWEDAQYSVTLFHSFYQPVFGMIAVSKRLDGLARTARDEAIRLDKQEAPQREIERKKQQEERDRAAQDDARAVNKPTFRF